MLFHPLKERHAFIPLIILFILILYPAVSSAGADEMAEAHNYLGIAYGDSGMYKGAIEAYKQTIRIKPDDAEAYNCLGIAYGVSGMYKEEIEAYKQAIRIKPDIVTAHNNLGVAYLKLNDRGMALEEYKILKDLAPKMANKLFNLIHK